FQFDRGQASIRHGSLSSTKLPGCASLPAIAEAATTAGLARYTNESLLPMRPRKLRLVEDTQVSPAARIPWCTPTQGPQPGGLIMAPAATRVSRYPRCIASR